MRICSGAGCLRAVQDSVRYCDECKPSRKAADEIREHTSGYDAELDRLRKGPKWQRVRREVVLRDPLCRRCELHITEEVDHIVPAREAIAQAQTSGHYTLNPTAGYYFKTNLQGLCRECHRAKTIEDKTHVGDWPDIVEKERAAMKARVWSF